MLHLSYNIRSVYFIWDSIYSLVFIPGPPMALVAILESGITPILASFFYCFIINRKNFRFNSKNIVSKTSVYRFGTRIIAILCFLLLGYFIAIARLNTFGSEIISIIYNFNLYILTSLFSAVFAITEYLCVKTNSV